MKFDSSRQILEKHSNIKFHKNPFSWNRDVSCGRIDGQKDRQTRRS